ncbi:mannose-6-phosphate isomerase, class I [Mesobacillus harenae]|uniref:mannose-6-phosphate isomerase, class I n=1 Tax=Mesobacillus harenae TaxID=2213203 RepID=UPI00158089EF|nr:mannose-6-phosphate isomerase, class I [Mesobacillus harenae]
MVKEPLFFEPVFKERIWGGESLKQFGYELPSSQTGECWAFADHHDGQSVVKNGELKGKTLGELWETNRELFGSIESDRFPLLTKILDVETDLSVQVHPDDEYAKNHENGELGKTECWYIVEAEEGAEIVYGHHAKTKEELESMINDGNWDELLRKVPVRAGDFFYVPSGTVHSIGKGTVTLVTQQNSDTAYRFFDYGRRNKEGNLSELHIKRSLDVITVPTEEFPVDEITIQHGDMDITTFVKAAHFSVFKWDLKGKSGEINEDVPFQLISVIDGEGTLFKGEESFSFKKGDHFLLPAEFGKFSLEGNASIIASHV